MLFPALAAMSQNLNVTGTVTEKTGGTLIGVTVVEKGTTNGTVTDVNGNYKIAVPKGSTLVFSYVGYVTKESVVEKEGVINIVLEEEISTLEDVIVIGYQTQKKTDKTGAVSLVKSDELNGGVITDPIQALQGKAAGVVISKQGGDPNSSFAVRIRGVSGYSANTQPLYVIDGIPNADPTMISPDDIESYNVLKDAASTAIYGSQGSNGVIIITTKKGSEGQKGIKPDGSFSNVEFTSQVSVERIAKKLKLLSSSDIRSYVNTLLQQAR
ncbi:MAG: TonB-dependent receptor plug domain-containing protein, partial [Syntrophothermus sp.]